MESAEKTRLENLLRVFIDEVHWEGCAGVEVTDEMRVTIAAQACLLILGLDQDDYRKVKTILIYPSGYRRRHQTQSAGGIVSEGVAHNAGEAWTGGPVILAWDETVHGCHDPEDGRNLVLHEFAHKLDMLDGYADGLPPAGNRARYNAWRAIVEDEYASLVRDVERRRQTFLDSYGATNPAEFFAVATEAFFERPRRLRRKHAELYEMLETVYQQDPAARRARMPERR